MLSGAVDLVDWIVDAARGLIGLPPRPPVLLVFGFDEQPKVRVLTLLQVQTRRSVMTRVVVEQDRAVIFDGPATREGAVGVLPQTGATMRIRVTIEGRDPAARNGRLVMEASADPEPNGPAIERFDVPAKVVFGDPIAIAWESATAERVRLAMIEDAKVKESIEAPRGQVLVHPSRPGRLIMRLNAETSWGQRSATRIVRVVPPVPPKVRLSTPAGTERAGHPGEEIRFEWRSENATELWLISPGCETPQAVPAEGVLFVALGRRPAEFVLTARGRDGAEKSVTFRAVPQPFAILEAEEG
jgi:hypothetical protein